MTLVSLSEILTIASLHPGVNGYLRGRRFDIVFEKAFGVPWQPGAVYSSGSWTRFKENCLANEQGTYVKRIDSVIVMRYKWKSYYYYLDLTIFCVWYTFGRWCWVEGKKPWTLQPPLLEWANSTLDSSTSSSKRNLAGSKVTLVQSTVLHTTRMDQGKWKWQRWTSKFKFWN